VQDVAVPVEVGVDENLGLAGGDAVALDERTHEGVGVAAQFGGFHVEHRGECPVVEQAAALQVVGEPVGLRVDVEIAGEW
jgi:hypothetical protein